MSILKIGNLIQARRQELGISQEDLADGICAVPTLSRIENGERMPTKNHFEALMERLGYSSIMLDCYIDKKTLQVQELKHGTQLAYINREMEKAREYLQQMQRLVDESNRLDWQFVLLFRVLLYPQNLAPAQMLEMLEEALALSRPNYKEKGMPHILSYQEISIYNGIAGAYEKLEQREEAIAILRHIRAYYDRHVVIPEEALRTQPMILYNLSKLLGLDGQYDECIEVCAQGIRIARQTSRCTNLATTLYNKAWALLRRGREEDRQQAERVLRQACYQAYAMEKEYLIAPIVKYYETEFGPLKL